MALPKLETTRHELKLPSTGETIEYRPFLVKEQKILMIASETGSQVEFTNAIIDIVKACTFGKIDAENLATFDIEYIFVNIRAKSIGSKTTIKILCPDDEETYVEKEIDLEKSKVTIPKDIKFDIDITDNIQINMGYPTLKEISLIVSDSEEIKAEQLFEIVKVCVLRIIEKIGTEEKVYERQDFTTEDLDEFIGSLNTEQFNKIKDFFENMPKLSQKVKVKNPKTEVESEVEIQGMQNFLE